MNHLFSAFDHDMMALAIKLARRGQFTTTPNPNVGCVIVDDNNTIVGQGWHHKAGTPHAEVHALKQAQGAAKGATAYVTLEPCSHFGRTPPCAQALIDAQIARVVVAMEDPNPKVSGKGMAMLSAQGIAVSSGLLSDQARQLNVGFLHRMTTQMPWITVKLASSLDGKTALENGESQWITGPAARRDVQRHRAKSCAILSGSGTVLADDPSLNVRHEELDYTDVDYPVSTLRQPARVILDGKNQLHGNLKLFTLPGDCYVINRSHNNVLPDHVTQIQVATVGNKLNLNDVVNVLGGLEFNHVWVEAGGLLAGAFLQHNLINELILYQAPKLLGDKGKDLFVMQPLSNLQQAKHLSWTDIRKVGNDVKMTAVLTRQNT